MVHLLNLMHECHPRDTKEYAKGKETFQVLTSNASWRPYRQNIKKFGKEA